MPVLGGQRGSSPTANRPPAAGIQRRRGTHSKDRWSRETWPRAIASPSGRGLAVEHGPRSIRLVEAAALLCAPPRRRRARLEAESFIHPFWASPDRHLYYHRSISDRVSVAGPLHTTTSGSAPRRH